MAIHPRATPLDYGTLPIGAGAGQRLSAKWHMPAPWYTASIGGGLADVFMIDTQDYLNFVQGTEMQAAVNNSTATWKIVVGHHPRFTSGFHQFDNNLSGLFGMFGFQSGVYCRADLYLSGHDHNREFIDKGADAFCPNTYFAVSGAGSTVRESTSPVVPPQLFYDHAELGFAYLELSENEMVFEFYTSLAADCTRPQLAYRLVVPR